MLKRNCQLIGLHKFTYRDCRAKEKKNKQTHLCDVTHHILHFNMSLPQTLCPVNISIDSQTCSYDGVNECFNGNVNSVWVQHNPLIIPTKTFHHFKVSAVITMLWGVPDPHNQRLLLSHTHSDTHTYTHIHYTDVHTVHTHKHAQTNCFRYYQA